MKLIIIEKSKFRHLGISNETKLTVMHFMNFIIDNNFRKEILLFLKVMFK